MSITKIEKRLSQDVKTLRTRLSKQSRELRSLRALMAEARQALKAKDWSKLEKAIYRFGGFVDGPGKNEDKPKIVTHTVKKAKAPNTDTTGGPVFDAEIKQYWELL